MLFEVYLPRKIHLLSVRFHVKEINPEKFGHAFSPTYCTCQQGMLLAFDVFAERRRTPVNRPKKSTSSYPKLKWKWPQFPGGLNGDNWLATNGEKYNWLPIDKMRNKLTTTDRKNIKRQLTWSVDCQQSLIFLLRHWFAYSFRSLRMALRKEPGGRNWRSTWSDVVGMFLFRNK